jgi:hypothetical protein
MRHDTALHEATAEAGHGPGHNARHFDSLPDAAHGITAGAFGGMMLVYWLVFGAHAEAALSVAVSTVYVVMFFGTPWMLARLGESLLRQRHGGNAAPSLRDFLGGWLDTWTGPMSGWSALIQVTLIPVGLALATLGIGLAIIAAR